MSERTRLEVEEEECSEGYPYWVDFGTHRALFATRAEADAAIAALHAKETPRG